MAQRSVPRDTDPQAFDALVERWRSMTIAERVAQIERINADVDRVARAGIHAIAPELSRTEIRRELARRRYGAQLADEAYEHLCI